MKNVKRIFSLIFAVTLLLSVCMLTSCTGKVSDYQESVVYINTTIEFEASNYDLLFRSSFVGTGFALGEPGEPVQYIGTCAHCVSEPAGVYSVIINLSEDTYEGYVLMSEGTSYPSYTEYEENGDMYALYTDYFTTTPVALNAVFSQAVGDYVSMTIAQINHDADLAICKLASEPTTKITALPLQLKENVERGDSIVAIGYPVTSSYFNDEGRFDSSDSTLKDGIVSKFQRTTVINNSEKAFDTYEITAQISGGMSGGPVVDLDSGAIIGVSAFGYTDASQVADARYAICIDYMIEMLERENIPYATGSGFPLMLVIIIAVGVLLVGGVVVLIILLTKKKPAAPAPAPVNNAYAAPAPAPHKYYLIGVAGPLAGKKFAITTSAVIGRDSSKCNVVFPSSHPGVSAVHCEIKLSGSVLTLKDCGSSYGTYLDNGAKLEPNNVMILNSGTKFYVGSDKNAFEVKY